MKESSIKTALRRYARANRKAREAKRELIEELRKAKASGSTFQELGDLIGVSRQRVHQILNENET